MMRKIARQAILFPIKILDNLLANRQQQIVFSSGFERLNNDFPILFYVHYSKQNKLTQQEVKSLKALKEAQFQVCLLLNSDQPSKMLFDEIVNQYSEFTKVQMLRKNKGYDLGGYRDSMLKLGEYSELENSKVFYMNNSIFWFPDMITKYFYEIQNLKCDVFAGSISKQYRTHIQTFLLGSTSSAGKREIEAWLNGVKNWRFKSTVVSFGELSTNQIFDKKISITSNPTDIALMKTALVKLNDFNIFPKTVVNPNTIYRLQENRALAFAGLPLNPSHAYWLELIELGFPGIKIDLIRRNSSAIDDYELAVHELIKSGVTFEELAIMLSSNAPISIIYRLRSRIKF
jgi:hypothetical protein